MSQFVKKRNGTIVPFDAFKIKSAITKANILNDVGPSELLNDQKLSLLTSEISNQILNSSKLPTVETIQDTVEKTLVSHNLYKTAKAYILYRNAHSKIRNNIDELRKIFEDLTFQDSKNSDLKRENANINADSAMGTMLKYGSESSKYFLTHNILPPKIAKAHLDGDIHIHDADFYMLTETCCQIDLLKLFKNGFFTGHGTIREPNSITSYASLACIAIQANQNEMHGGQAVPNFDFCMEPGVKKTFRHEFLKIFANYLEAVFKISSKDFELKQISKNIDLLNVSLSNQTNPLDFGSFFTEKYHNVYSHIFPEQWAEAFTFSFSHAKEQTERLTYQAMEAFIHNLNTMNSRAGAQVPFSSLNYGTCISPEGRMVIKNLLLATDRGLGNGETPIFPVQIFKVKEGVNYNHDDPNYDLFKLAMKTSAKRLFPNFSFLDAPFNLKYYKKGDYNSEVAYMGCRTRVMENIDKTKEVTCGRGNLSFTTINLPRLGIRANKDIQVFYKLLDEQMDICIQQLLHRFNIQCHKHVYNYPFLMGQNIWLDSDKLSLEDTVGEVLRHGTLSVGFIGLAETLVALTGKHHGESEDSRKLGLEIIKHMRERTNLETQKNHLNFSLFATPAEGLSGRFVKLDAKRFGIIKGVTDREYYTNSFHVPVYYPISAFKKIQIEAPYHALTNAGHISYVELDGDTCKNIDAFESVIRCMKESGIGYGSVNHPVDRDPICGYNGVIDNICPRCGRHEGEAVSIEKLNALRKKYANVPNYLDY